MEMEIKCFLKSNLNLKFKSKNYTKCPKWVLQYMRDTFIMLNNEYGKI